MSVHGTLADGRSAANPSVVILLGALNGARFLRAQLESIEQQNFANWRLFVSDDGSSDETCAILREFQERQAPGRVILTQGPRRGFAANFLSLVCDDGIRATHYAFSDQDDIWQPNKLSRAIDRLVAVAPGIPALYCSRTQLIDDRDKAIGFSPLFTKKPGFANALVQSIAGGNTMVFNDRARDILRAVGTGISVPAHDWLIYQAVTAIGGEILYDSRPSVCYRVHGGSATRSNQSFRSRVGRIRSGCLRTWIDQNVMALNKIRPYMTPENRRTLDMFHQARTRGLVARVLGFARSGIYRQTALGNIGLIAAALSGMI